MRDFGGLWSTGNTCYVNVVLQCLLRLPDFLPALPRDSWLAARLAAHEPPRDVDDDAADYAASVELEESMEAFRTEEACALRRLVAFSDIQQTLRAAAVDEEQLKR
jgi:ubiquitin C-terminal hydrolase